MFEMDDKITQASNFAHRAVAADTASDFEEAERCYEVWGALPANNENMLILARFMCATLSLLSPALSSLSLFSGGGRIVVGHLPLVSAGR